MQDINDVIAYAYGRLVKENEMLREHINDRESA